MPVTTPVRQGALTTLTRVKEELGIGAEVSDALLQRMINAASQLIERYCNRVFNLWEGVEYVRGYGSERLILTHTPIKEVREIKYGLPPNPDEVIDPSKYMIDEAEAGFVLLTDGSLWKWTGRVRRVITPHRLPGTEMPMYAVDYTGGYVTPKQAEDDPSLKRDLPYDIEDACVMLVATRWGSRGERRDIVSESVMSASFTYQRGGLPQEVIDILGPYRRVM